MKGGDGMRKWVVLFAVLISIVAFSAITLDTVGNWTIAFTTISNINLVAAKQNITAAVLNNTIRYDVATVSVGIFQDYYRTYEPQVIIAILGNILPVAKNNEVRCQIEYYDRNNKRLISFTAAGGYVPNAQLILIPTTVVMGRLQDYNFSVQTIKVSFKTNAGTMDVAIDMTYYALVVVKLAYWASVLGM
jgi:hypothetical protein